MKKIMFWLSFSLVGLMTASVLAQTAPAPYTMRLKPFLTGLTRPVLVRNAGDGSKRLFIVQQTGIIKVVQPGSTTPTNFIDLSSKITVPTATGDERGLLGLAFHPQFATNGKFYVNYTRAADFATQIVEYRTTTGTGSSNSGDITQERVLLTIPQPFANHNGGMIEFGPDGYLYIGTGDGGSANDPGNRAQNRAQLLGKFLRIDVNVASNSTVPYAIPPTNPFTGANTARCDGGSTTAGNTCQEIWAIGVRNPFRWSFDRGGTRQLWAADVGQDAIEEVDIITGGANYGWRIYEGNSCTNIDGCTQPANYTPPVFQYTHANGRCSITGGYVYRGTQGSLPSGAYIYADYCTGEILMWQNNQQTLLQDTPRFITSFGEDEDGELYVCYSNGQIDRISRAKASADFDGEFKTDLSVFRPSNGAWYISNSFNNSFRAQIFGQNGDVPTPEDFDGDNITDIAVFRPSNGTWYYLRSSNNTFSGVQLGQNGDVPAQGDFDGDAKADVAVFRPSNGTWYRQNSSNGAIVTTQFGQNGDVPAEADFDGDGKYDISVFRPSNGAWYRLNSSNGVFYGITFGQNGDVPVQGDFDGDGRADQAVYRGGFWYILNSSTGAFQGTQFGIPTDTPVVGDYDGDGKSDIAVFRASNGTWYYLNSSNGAFLGSQFGQNNDLPAPNYDAP